MTDAKTTSSARYRALAARLAAAAADLPRAPFDALLDRAKASVYPEGDALPFEVGSPRSAPARRVYSDLDVLVAAAARGEPAAAELALAALGEIVPADATALALEAYALGVWPAMRTRVYEALSRSETREAFEALLDAVRDDDAPAPTPGWLLSRSPFPGGCAVVLSKLEKSPVTTFSAVELPSAAQWDEMSASARRAFTQEVEDAAAAFEYADVAEAQDLLRYVGEKRCAAARPLVDRLYRGHPDEQVRLYAGPRSPDSATRRASTP